MSAEEAFFHCLAPRRCGHASCNTVNALTIDVEDYFQVEAFAPTIDRGGWKGCRGGSRATPSVCSTSSVRQGSGEFSSWVGWRNATPAWPDASLEKGTSRRATGPIISVPIAKRLTSFATICAAAGSSSRGRGRVSSQLLRTHLLDRPRQRMAAKEIIRWSSPDARARRLILLLPDEVNFIT